MMVPKKSFRKCSGNSAIPGAFCVLSTNIKLQPGEIQLLPGEEEMMVS